MEQTKNLLRALIRDDRGVAVAEYGMIVTVLGGLVFGLMTLGTNVNDSIRSVGSLLMGLTGHNY
jgi:Flp pilus assembly pilin Flp